jgi:hypothetical protein
MMGLLSMIKPATVDEALSDGIDTYYARRTQSISKK